MPARWEYQVLHSGVEGFFQPQLDVDALVSRLNELGAQGWEVVSMSGLEMAHGRTRDMVVLLKRLLD